MMRRAVVLAALVVSASAWLHAQQAAPPQADMAAMMEKAKKFTQPGPEHKALEQLVGKWNTETRMFMAGKPTPAEKGTAQMSWLMPGRWVKGEWSGPMMGLPMQGFLLIGYDRFKQSYVMTTVTSMDTAMNRSEGDLDPFTKAILLYGTLDEYLTGEHDKMVKSIWRFPSPDRIVFEVHDLPIGENNTKVVEVTFTRAQ